MKCDELKIYRTHTDNLGDNYIDAEFVDVVLKEDVDNAIAELKEENKLLKEHIANGDVSRITWIDEVIELKQKLHDAEMRADLAECAETERKIDYDNLKKDLAYHARQIYFKHNRQTLRALWLARANRASEKIAWFKLWNASISTMNPEDGARKQYDKWKKALGKFLKKAEEYK